MANYRKRSWISSLVAPGGFALLAAGGLVGVLWGLGIVHFQRGEPTDALALAPGRVRVFVPVAPIPAYTRVTREHVTRPGGALSYLDVDPAFLSSDSLTSIPDFSGRVLKRDKPAGYAFTQADFFPKGTPPGIAAGIPPGKRAFRVEAEKFSGLVGLGIGDRFDIVSTVTIDPKVSTDLSALPPTYRQQYQLQMQLQQAGVPGHKQAAVRVVVQNGSIVQPVTTRQVNLTSASLTQGVQVKTRPVQEVVLAVAPAEVAQLSEALAINAELLCVPRSGRSSSEEEAPTPEHIPRSPFASFGGTDGPGGLPALTPVETIAGDQKDVRLVPKTKDGKP